MNLQRLRLVLLAFSALFGACTSSGNPATTGGSGGTTSTGGHPSTGGTGGGNVTGGSSSGGSGTGGSGTGGSSTGGSSTGASGAGGSGAGGSGSGGAGGTGGGTAGGSGRAGAGGGAGATGGAGAAGASGAAGVARIQAYDGQRGTGFDDGWRFHLCDVTWAQQTSFDDSSWRSLSVPHDWSAELPFNKSSPAGGGGGFLDGGVGWYRKTFTLDASYAGREIRIAFDGVYM